MSTTTGKVIKYSLIFSITPIVALIVYISFQLFGIDVGIKYVIYMLLLIFFVKIIIAGVLIGVSEISGYPLLKDNTV